MTLPATSSTVGVAPIVPAPLMTMPTFTDIFSAMTAQYGLAPRASQLELAGLVRNTLTSAGVGCFEAPTGTGKTLGYLTGALDAQAHMGNPIPIVVATATIGLQEQILRDDIPRLVEIGAVDARKVAVAKGRGRYFCPRTASMLEDKKMQDNQFDMFNSEKHVADGGIPIALDMLGAWREGRWNGDRDSWDGEIPACWASACGASSETCINRSCEHFDSCPYMLSRQKLGAASLIIANHSIVISDLLQRSDEEATSTVLPPKNYMLVLDEAHRFPDVAVSTREARAALYDRAWLEKLPELGENLMTIPGAMKALNRLPWFKPSMASGLPDELMRMMEVLEQELLRSTRFNTSGTFSWGLKEPSAPILERVAQLRSRAEQLQEMMMVCGKALTEHAEGAVGAERALAVRLLTSTHAIRRKNGDLLNGFELFSDGSTLVRWVSKTSKDGIALKSQPVEGKDVLDELLWGTGIPVVMVSATLQIDGAFDRFRAKSGLPSHSKTAALAPVFDYSRGYLHQPSMSFEPGEPGYERELSEKITLLFERKVSPGMLVLFTSRDTMQRVFRNIPLEIQSNFLVQGSRPVPELVANHKQRVLNGQRSVLFGLETMSEGLDLPGGFCGHVVITRLPFAVPGDPVEEARKDLLKDKWFMQSYLADMLTMLIQASGRLIRRETDHGVITLLDSRMSSKRYAYTAFRALPSFTRCIKLSDYFEGAEKRKFDRTFGLAPKKHLTLVPKPVAAVVVESVEPPVAAAPVVASQVSGADVVQTENRTPLQILQEAWNQTAAVQEAITQVDGSIWDLLKAASPMFSSGLDGEVPFLCDERGLLPGGTPLAEWALRGVPSAVMAGLLACNEPWPESAPAWEKLLRVRMDVLQYALVLRDLRAGVDDGAHGLSEATCLSAAIVVLGRIQPPTADELLSATERMVESVRRITSKPFVLASADTLTLMADSSVALAKQLRTTK